MSGRIIVIEQPCYIPWIGYFDLINQADVWVWLDDVQYTKRDWRNRNRVADGTKWEWLTVPVLTKGRYTQEIGEVEIDRAQPWGRKHLAAMERCYGRSPHFEQVFAVYREVVERDPRLLTDLTIPLNEELCRLMGLQTGFLRSSSLRVDAVRQERLLRICEQLACKTYLSGPAARAYIDPEEFKRRGVALRYIRYDYPPHARSGQAMDEPLSIVDFLCWLGPAETRAFLEAHGKLDAEEA